MIELDRFGWRFAGAASWTLLDLSLRVDRGEFVAVAGSSGSGKTTLALATCGLLVGRHAGETRGCVRVAGADVAATPLHQIARSIGLVQQNPETHFATLTVADEIAFGMENACVDPPEIRRRVDEAMELLSIGHLRDRTLSTLSGGEQQRVAVASIVAGKPDALVLDEPTASLDPQASRDLFHRLADLSERTGLTVIIIEHKLHHLLPLVSRVVCLESGGVISDTRNPSIVAKVSRPAESHSFAQAAAQPKSDPIVDVSDLNVQVDGRAVLTDVSLRVHAGEVVAIMGPNGGGKTTLLHSILGLLKPTRGTVRINGQSPSSTGMSRLTREVGVVFQNADHQLVADTVQGEALLAAQNFGRLDAGVEKHADLLLDRSGLTDRRTDHPYRLSWGQKRRLNLVSAVLHRPRLLLLDEPFAGQDSENAAFLLAAIQAVCDPASGPVVDRSSSQPGREPGAMPEPSTDGVGACLMVTHDPRILDQGCTRVVFLSEGRVLVDAPAAQAFGWLAAHGYDAYVPTELHVLSSAC